MRCACSSAEENGSATEGSEDTEKARQKKTSNFTVRHAPSILPFSPCPLVPPWQKLLSYLRAARSQARSVKIDSLVQRPRVTNERREAMACLGACYGRAIRGSQRNGSNLDISR